MLVTYIVELWSKLNRFCENSRKNTAQWDQFEDFKMLSNATCY